MYPRVTGELRSVKQSNWNSRTEKNNEVKISVDALKSMLDTTEKKIDEFRLKIGYQKNLNLGWI